MNYQQFSIDYELDKICEYYLDKIQPSIWKNKFPNKNFNIEEFNHRGSETLGNRFFSNFPILFSELKKTFGENNFFGRYFVTKPQSKGFIHVDAATGNYLSNEFTAGKDFVCHTRYWSYNIPLINCTNNYQEWFSVQCDPSFLNEFNSWYFFEEKNSNLIDSLELKSPFFVNTAVPHRINNPTNEERIVLAIRTVDNSKNLLDRLSNINP